MADASTDLGDTIADNAVNPAEASGDSSRIKQHSLKDQIEADKYLRAKAAQGSTGLGLIYRRTIPPGAVPG